MKQSIKRYGKMIWVLVALFVFQACYPGGSIPIEDLDTTSTFYIVDDFNTAPTNTALVWEVARILGDDNNLEYNGEKDDLILNTTLANLVSLYTEAGVTIIAQKDANGDLIGPEPKNFSGTILLYEEGAQDNPPVPNVESAYTPSIKLTRETVGIVYPGYPWYPGGGWGCWYCSPCYYCGYPPTVSYTSYDVGSIILELIDVRKLTPGEIPSEFNPSWVAIFRGLVSSNPTTNDTRVRNNINQAFAQSAYLKP